MNKILTILIFILIFTFTIFGQTKSSPKSSSTSKITSTETNKNEHSQVSEEVLLAQLQLAKNNLSSCFQKYFVYYLEDFKKCEVIANKEISEIHKKISNSPSAIQMLLNQTLQSEYKNSVARLQSKSEASLENIVETQRLLVIQNQRIIELLEQLLKKK